MSWADWIGSLGVALLLLAFVLNLTGRLGREGWPYATINVLGAGLSGLASYLIDFMPFVILEATWCLAALVSLGRIMAGRARA
jgi:hypothetical protein